MIDDGIRAVTKVFPHGDLRKSKGADGGSVFDFPTIALCDRGSQRIEERSSGTRFLKFIEIRQQWQFQ